MGTSVETTATCDECTAQMDEALAIEAGWLLFHDGRCLCVACKADEEDT